MTVSEFLASLPAERRTAVQAVRKVIKANLPKGYKEEMAGKILAYVVPLSVYPDTYNGHALWLVGLANQKNYVSLHMVMAYMNPPLRTRLEEGFRKAGKRLDMGKGCINYNDPDELDLDVIGDVIASVPMDRYIATAKAVQEARKVKKVKKG